METIKDCERVGQIDGLHAEGDGFSLVSVATGNDNAGRELGKMEVIKNPMRIAFWHNHPGVSGGRACQDVSDYEY